MSRILVIGGYGGFGARLCRRLAAAGHVPVVAGRSREKAAALCATLPRAEPLAIDRGAGVGEALARCRPDLVIDAAGPFQGNGYGVPAACIDLGIPYLDLADARDFVGAIGTLDRRARAAGVAVISGASSVPALSGAVARALAVGLDRVETVEIALSAANGASGGRSVIASILSYVGRPVRLWRGGRWVAAYGWQELRRERFAVGGRRFTRLVAIADVPDCDLLPALLPGRPSVTFRAGSELGLHVLALWLASWPVRWRLLPSLLPAEPLLARLYGSTKRIGGRRSGMTVTLRGEAAGRLLERRWSLVADRGHGIEVPTLAAALLAQEVLARRVAPGARDAAGLLSLDAFRAAWADLAIADETCERVLSPCDIRPLDRDQPLGASLS